MTHGIPRFVRTTLLYGLWIAPGQAQVQDSTKIHFDIPATTLNEALRQYEAEANVELLVLDDAIKNVTAPAVKGDYSKEHALELVISRSKLCFEFAPDRASVTLGSCSIFRSTVRRESASNSSRSRPSPASRELTPAELESVLVTGSHISGQVDSVGPNRIVLTQEDFARYNVTHLDDLGRLLTLIFGGGPSQDTHDLGAETQTNSGLGSATNVRALGARATLLLLNGRRLAPSGISGSFFDNLNIPISAIKRVEILPDGASAIYGADAVAAVVNIITRDRHDENESAVHVGAVTQGAWQEGRVSQALSNDWTSGGAFGSVEFSKNTALPARDRGFGSSDLRSSGGPNLALPEAWPPTIVVGKQTWAAPPGLTGLPSITQLQPGARNLEDVHSNSDLMPRQELESVYGQVQQSLGDHLTLTVEGMLTHRRATESDGGDRVDIVVPPTSPYYLNQIAQGAPMVVERDLFNVLGPKITQVDVRMLYEATTVSVPFGTDEKLDFSVSRALETEHQRTTGVASASALSAGFDPFATGSQSGLQGYTSFDLGSELHEYSAQWSGTVAGTAAGPVKGAVGLEYRTQSLSTSDSVTSPGGFNRYDRRLKAAFAEWTLPVMGRDRALPALQSLELSLAGRYEDYSDFGHSTVPRIGFHWTLTTELELRGSWGKSIRTPNLPDLNTSRNTVATGPAPFGPGEVIYMTGNNPHLHEERARTGTLEMVFSKAISDDSTLILDADVYDIHYFDRVQALDISTAGPDLLTNPIYSSVVLRNPSAVAVEQACTSPQFHGSMTQCLAGQYLALVDLRIRNVDTLLTRGIDFKGSWQVKPSWGTLELSWIGTYILKYADKPMPTAPLQSLRDTQNQPIDLQTHASIDVTWRGVGAQITANFADSYRDTISQPNRRIASWTTLDLQLRYEPDVDRHDWRYGLFISLDVQNVANHNPPFLVNYIEHLGYDEENADPLNRVVSLQVRKRW